MLPSARVPPKPARTPACAPARGLRALRARSAPRRAWLFAALFLLGCGGTASPDGGLDAPADVGPAPGPLALVGPDFPFVREEACFASSRPLAADETATFVFGDGETSTLAPGLGEACHTYRVPGPYVVGLALASARPTERATKLVHVVFAPRALVPSRSSSIVLEAGRIVAVEPDADLVVVMAEDGTVARRVPVGDRPRSVAVLGERLLVACEGDGTLHAIGPDGHAIVPLGAGSGAFAVALDPRGGHAFVSLLRSGELAVLATDGAVREVARVRVGPDPRALAVRDDGLVLVSHWRSTEAAARVTLVDAGDPRAPRVASEALLPRETGRDADTDNDGVLSFVEALALSPDGGRALVGGLKANVVGGLFRTGEPLSSQTTARGALAELLLGGVAEPAEDSLRRPLDDLDAVAALTFSPMGELVYFAVPGAEVVLVADAFSLDTVASIDDVGHAVDGLALVGETLYVHAALSREVRAYDVSALSSGSPAPRWVARTVEVEPLPPDVLAGAILFGRSRDPRMGRTRYLSCASCHRDGEGDNLVWDFTQRGEGLRNTTPLVGRAGTAHGPLHWSANFDEVQDFEHDIRGSQGGTGFLSDELFHAGSRGTTLGDPKAGLSPELDALAAYLSSLDRFGSSPHRRDGDPAWESSRARGEAIFRDPARGCAGCHAGPRYTDSAFTAPGVPVLHDVGTLGSGSGARLGLPLTGLDTPTLRGLWASAPYLHDGSAATLDEVIGARNTEDRHGVTSDLGEAERADLVTFLLSLDDLAP